MKVLVTDRWRPVHKHKTPPTDAIPNVIIEESMVPPLLRLPADRKKNDTVLYVVDETGAGTHKTVEDALVDAAKNPSRRTMVKIVPHTTIENFDRPSESIGGP